MRTKSSKQALVWGGLLIFLGIVSLLDNLIEFSAWTWVGVLVVGGLIVFAIFLTDRSDWLLLLPAYTLWAIAGLIAVTVSEILRGEAIAFYVLSAVALPFLVVFLRNRQHWWALIPAYTLFVVGLMVGLIGLGILDDLLIPAYVMFAIAIPFFVIFARNRQHWWALIPAGILTAIGISFLLAEDMFIVIGPVLLIIAGAFILFRALRPSS
jgi:hypothetical protein